MLQSLVNCRKTTVHLPYIRNTVSAFYHNIRRLHPQFFSALYHLPHPHIRTYAFYRRP